MNDMITFLYDDKNKCGRWESENDYAYMQSCTLNQQKYGDLRSGRFPMTDENINRLLTKYRNGFNDVEWKLSMIEAVVDHISKNIDDNASMDVLQSFTLDRAKDMPSLLKPINDNPPPFANQKIGQYWAKYKDKHAMLWEMGTGKTRGAVETYEIKKKAKQVDHGLVVCPVSMIDKWVDEIDKWSGNQSAIGIKGNRAEKEEALSQNWDWYVVSFESLKNLFEIFKEIVDDRWFIVLDEFTKIKNPHAKRAKACVELGKLTEHKAILSGTPVTQHAYDVFTPYYFLDNGKTFGTRYDDFIDKYFWRQGFKLIPKRGSLDAIGDLMYNSATRFLKKDCIDIPDKLYTQRYLDLPAYNKQKYDEMVNYCITQINESDKVTAFVILTQLLRLSQITSGFVKDVTGREIAFDENPKIDALRDIMEEANGTPTVIWARFIWDCNAISKLLKEMNITHSFLNGETSHDDRTRNIKEFADGKVQVIIGTAGTGGHGIDLVRGSLCIYYSNSYSLEQRLQSEDRLHRAGQKNQVTYIDLLCKNTVDVAIYKILRNKKNIADIVTKDNMRDLL
jgi:SNF2 family DNA or RNA helicase